jgi:outer membrane protein OmpA-like peptidoglycan-associated protein
MPSGVGPLPIPLPFAAALGQEKAASAWCCGTESDVSERKAVRRLARVSMVVAAALVSGCAGSSQQATGSRTATGAGVGAVLGGVAGAVLDKNDVRGVLLGAAAGAALGSGIGYWLDRQQTELEAALEPASEQRMAAVERVADDRLKVTINDEIAFDYKSAAIRPSFLPTLERVADVLDRYGESRVLVVGHTDSVGPDDYNQRLSQERAASVREALATYGVDPQRIRAEGRGEAEPRADNTTEAGQAANRRVEILITPVA